MRVRQTQQQHQQPRQRRRQTEDHVVDDLLQQHDPLDEHEQELVVAGLRALAARQERGARRALAALSAVLASLFTWLTCEQLARPFQMRHTGELRAVVGGGRLGPGLALAAQAAALWATAAAMMVGENEGATTTTAAKPRAFAALSSLLPALYWWHAMLTHARAFLTLGVPWELAWLPLAPLTLVAVAEAARQSWRATRREVEQLESARYDHKRV